MAARKKMVLMALKGEMPDVHSHSPRVDSRYIANTVFIRYPSSTKAGPRIGYWR